MMRGPGKKSRRRGNPRKLRKWAQESLIGFALDGLRGRRRKAKSQLVVI